MAKKLIQDIFVKKETVRREPLVSKAEPSFQSPRVRGPLFSKKRVVIGLVLLGVVGFFFSASVFGSATLDIVQRSATVVVDDAYSALRKEDPLAVHFEVMKIEDEATAQVPANGFSDVTKKATGTILVYNAFSAAEQRLVANTRFETADGKIYKADKAIVIPGMKGTVPGSVSAAVTAAEAGDAYNIGLVDFTVPGLKGTPKYEKIYARSKTEMKGGAQGKQKIAKDTDILDARHRLEESLRISLLEKAKKQTAEGYLFYEGADFGTIAFARSDDSSASPDSLEVHAKGVLYGVILERTSLARAIAHKKIEGYGGEAIDITNPEALTFAIANKESIDPEKVTAITLAFTGSADLRWTLDEAALRQDLVGVSKSDYGEVLKKYPTIEKAEALFSPPWIIRFPSNPEAIAIRRK
ncbi:MAG: hypothetical protein V4674_03075 [Patescibacteria group bacterium]